MAKYPSKVIDNAYGKALIAAKDLETGTIVERFLGKVIKYSEVSDHMICHAIFVGEKGEDKWIESNTDAIRANHSCEPNCTIDEKLNIVTTKLVKKDEELTFSYNMLDEGEAPKDYFWDSRWNFECKCGSKNCQKNIDKYIKPVFKK
ncbi:MAG: SET domain-containing protein-lysine N-methyltransferase [archaeon]